VTAYEFSGGLTVELDSDGLAANQLAMAKNGAAYGTVTRLRSISHSYSGGLKSHAFVSFALSKILI